VENKMVTVDGELKFLILKVLKKNPSAIQYIHDFISKIIKNPKVESFQKIEFKNNFNFEEFFELTNHIGIIIVIENQF
jgi:translation elongation factor EF-Ts